MDHIVHICNVFLYICENIKIDENGLKVCNMFMFHFSNFCYVRWDIIFLEYFRFQIFLLDTKISIVFYTDKDYQLIGNRQIFEF